MDTWITVHYHYWIVIVISDESIIKYLSLYQINFPPVLTSSKFIKNCEAFIKLSVNDKVTGEQMPGEGKCLHLPVSSCWISFKLSRLRVKCVILLSNITPAD